MSNDDEQVLITKKDNGDYAVESTAKAPIRNFVMDFLRALGRIRNK